MEKKYWFAVKKIGWGWTPSTWQGWLVTILYVVICIVVAPITKSILLSLLTIFAATVVFLLICHRKGEKLPKLF